MSMSVIKNSRHINGIAVLFLFVLSLWLNTTNPASDKPINKGHNLGQLRGAMIGMDVTGADISELGKEWHANLIRWQLFREGADDDADIEAYWTWLMPQLDKLDTVLDDARDAGMKVLIDLHTTPGGRDGDSVNRIFTDQDALDNFYEVWRTIARRYKDNSVVWGYDLVNEPLTADAQLIDSWHNIATYAAREIRQIDTTHSIIVEADHYALPEGFSDFEPINIDNVVYSVHVYNPHAFTHQGLSDFGPTGIAYPGYISGQYWDKEALLDSLQPVIDFQNKYSVAIYVGEFSAIRWAPGDSAYQYIKDAIDIFESLGWDWSYHAFREWQGWSVEYPAGTQSQTPASTPTQREQLLRGWFAKNTKPKYFYTIYPDDNTHFYYAQNRFLSCNLPALYDDQANTAQNRYDVIWQMDPASLVFSVITASLASQDCNHSLLDTLQTTPIQAGFAVNLDEAQSFLSQAEQLRACHFTAQYFDEKGNQRYQEQVDVDWYFNEQDASWHYLSANIPAIDNCLNNVER